MSLKHLTALVAASAVTAVPLVAVPAASASTGEPAGNRSLAKVLAGDGQKFDSTWGDFDIVDKAVRTVLGEKPKSPVATLAKGRVAVTAFLPTDRAFRILVHDLTGEWKHTERGVFRALAGVADIDTLESVLLYHVVPGATVTYRQALGSDGAELETALAGGTVEVNVTERPRVRLLDADPNDANARVVPALRNINKGNKQIAHGIDRVLRPADL